MKKRKQTTAVLIMLFLLLALLAGCMNPPDEKAAQQRFYSNQDDIQTVTTFLIDICENGGNAAIEGTDGTMRVTYRSGDRYVTETVEIEDPAVRHAVERLLGEGQYKRIHKTDNTVLFLQWSRFFGAGCGVLYIADGSSKPSVQYLTELVPIADTGWYYYVDDPDA